MPSPRNRPYKFVTNRKSIRDEKNVISGWQRTVELTTGTFRGTRLEIAVLQANGNACGLVVHNDAVWYGTIDDKAEPDTVLRAARMIPLETA